MPLSQTTPDAAALLDELIPLQGASHADVVEYRVEVPLRYAQCIAALSDGRKVPLSDPRAFVGWAGAKSERSLLFRCGQASLELGLASQADASLPGRIRNIVFEALAPRCATTVRRFIGVDGGLVYQPA